MFQRFTETVSLFDEWKLKEFKSKLQYFYDRSLTSNGNVGNFKIQWM